jgi:hypothetical protein
LAPNCNSLRRRLAAVDERQRRLNFSLWLCKRKRGMSIAAICSMPNFHIKSITLPGSRVSFPNWQGPASIGAAAAAMTHRAFPLGLAIRWCLAASGKTGLLSHAGTCTLWGRGTCMVSQTSLLFVSDLGGLSLVAMGDTWLQQCDSG